MVSNKLLYLNNDINKHKFICSGISLLDLILYTESIENIIILKGECLGNRCSNNFEIFDNREDIIRCLKNNSNIYGDYCFMDFTGRESPDCLTDDEISNMLYSAHMFRIRETFQVNTLQNSFLCLSHDNGFFMKIYYLTIDIIQNLIEKKIVGIYEKIFNTNFPPMQDEIKCQLMEFSSHGILINFKNLLCDKYIMLRSIGVIDNMDLIYNKTESLEKDSLYAFKLHYNNSGWMLENG